MIMIYDDSDHDMTMIMNTMIIFQKTMMYEYYDNIQKTMMRLCFLSKKNSMSKSREI